MLDSTVYGPALSSSYDAVKNKGSLSGFEKLCDNFMVGVLKQSRFVPFGIEPVLSYLVAKEKMCIRDSVWTVLIGFLDMKRAAKA